MRRTKRPLSASLEEWPVLAVEAAPLPKLVDPLVVEIGLAGRRSHDRAGAMDEQTAQVLVPALRDAHQHLAIAAGELSRDETNSGGEVPTILEL
jgi:hypothetical protein